MRQNQHLTLNHAVMKGSLNHDNYSFQQQFGRTNHSRESSGDDCTNFCEAKGPMSPTAWMCEVTGKKMSQLCRPFMSGNSNIQLGKEDNSYKKPRSDNSDTSVASWRERAAKSILNVRNSDDEDSEDENGLESSRRKKLIIGTRNVGAYIEHLKGPFNGSQNSPNNEADSADDEPRIIAPNVDKISPISVVEVRLQSIRECVTILCSVDVLKMKSVFFYEVLNEQEENRIFSGHEQNHIWREPLLIPEVSPFEAAAFIESLHEGRQLCKGEWNYCWARLSVSWQVQELVAEYALLIKAHFGKLLSYIQQNNWRTNPNILVGARVAVFRKSATMLPTVVTGVATDAAITTGYSKVRVIFDPTESRGLSQTNLTSSSGIPCQSPLAGVRAPSPGRKINSFGVNSNNPPSRAQASTGSNSTPATSSGPICGDIGEPFWVQFVQPILVTAAPQISNQPMAYTPTLSQYNTPPNPRPNFETDLSKSQAPAFPMWCDPDEAFITEVKKHITIGDKIIFWEMSKAIMELPKLAEHCDSAIRNSKDLAAILKRTEFKFLWSAEAPDLLPKDAASELMSAAYVVNY